MIYRSKVSSQPQKHTKKHEKTQPHIHVDPEKIVKIGVIYDPCNLHCRRQNSTTTRIDYTATKPDYSPLHPYSTMEQATITAPCRPQGT
ncbi:hypothetical protein [Methanothermobacter sp. K4]|uniref:hypothetical protein n=1 Tax=Methanothermobacter sp. K4 TaxID=2913262 RepID=UPI001EDC7589|nr:hypothetical protein [Methanothermobacter sp. K4]MCG2829406.1 hypothetical protein [Methanothermobacter sp. K4]